MLSYSRLNLEHLDELIILNREVFNESEQYSHRYLESVCSKANGIVTFDKTFMIGFLLFDYIVSDNKEHCLRIVSLGVTKSHRRLGVGRSLLTMACSMFEGPVYLHVRESNKIAQSLYQSLSFKTVDNIIDYYESLIEEDDKREIALYMRNENIPVLEDVPVLKDMRP